MFADGIVLKVKTFVPSEAAFSHAALSLGICSTRGRFARNRGGMAAARRAGAPQRLTTTRYRRRLQVGRIFSAQEAKHRLAALARTTKYVVCA